MNNEISIAAKNVADHIEARTILNHITRKDLEQLIQSLLDSELSSLGTQLSTVKKERDEGDVMLSKVRRIIDIAEKANDAATEQEVAHSASFNEAMIMSQCDILEARLSTALATLEKIDAIVESEVILEDRDRPDDCRACHSRANNIQEAIASLKSCNVAK